jgi:hypothetical protein
MKLNKTTKSLLIAVVLVAALAVVDMVFSATPLDHNDVTRLASKLDGAEQVNWKWLDGPRNWLGERHGLCVSYRAVSNTVVIPRYLEPVAFDDIMLPSYVHELTHAAQCQRMGRPLFITTKTFRRGKLEAEAIREEKRAQKILGVHVL